MTTSVPSIPRPVDGGGAAVHPRAGYLRPDRTGFISGWTQPVLRESRHDVRAAWRPVAARAVETIQNSGWMAGAVDQAIADTLGRGSSSMRCRMRMRWGCRRRKRGGWRDGSNGAGGAGRAGRWSAMHAAR